MNVDIQTLTIAGAFVAFFAGVLLAGAWLAIARSPALLWWSAANFLQALCIGLIVAGQGAGHAPVMLAGVGLATLCPAVVWAGVRVFDGRRVPPLLLLAGTAVWLLVVLLPLEADIRGLAGFAAPVGYLAAACYELWRRSERLSARWGLIAFLALHCLTFLGGVFDTLAGRLLSSDLPGLNTWFGLINFESLVYSMGTALFMVVMVKERSERRIVAASRVDSLTGVANRGALLEGGERILRRCQQEGMSVSLIIFDLDHFKQVNDTYGHAAGDAVLRTFADTAMHILRPGDQFGRYGGEEFVVVLPRATIEAAAVIADRIRHAFAGSVFALTGVRCTVSAGVASAGSATVKLEDMINAADGCLYRAKANGRNRVERSERKAPDEPDSIVRIA
jgi:diguanylate cyclase (GGDEF)-like protein